VSRRPHYVKYNIKSEYPQQVIWFDTETRFTGVDIVPGKESDVIWYETQTEFKTSKHTTQYHWLKFGYACYMRRHHDGKWGDEEWIRFETVDQFWTWILSKLRRKIKLYLLCHNTSFDLPVLNIFEELPRRGWRLLSAIIDAPPTILRFRCQDSTIMVLDTLNIWRMPLRYLGEEIGLPKLDMPDNNDLTVEWETYARRDVEILRTACIKWWEFLESHDMGSFAPTLAGQSMRLYKHRYMDHKIFIDTNERALNLTREGYYGGRVECFKIGHFKGDFYLLDVNSMYPYVMAKYSYPSKCIAHASHVTCADLLTWLRNRCITARVTLRTTKPFAPIRDQGKLIFPIGTFQTILSSEEIAYALLYAEILHVHEAVVYEKLPLFTRFVTDLYFYKQDAKRRGDTVAEFMYKKLLNSFYGKWGQSGAKWIEYGRADDMSARRWPEIDLDEPDPKKRVKFHRQLGGLHQIKGEKHESRESFPAIAAHITANARMAIWAIIEAAKVDTVYYCDTDCVVVDSVGLSRLTSSLDDYKLGGLKIAGKYDDIQIWGAKDYRFGTKEKHKGVRKQAIWSDPHTVTQAKWSGLKGLIASGVVNRPLTQTITKRLSRLYDKGIVLADGTVLPLQKDDWIHP